MDFSIGMCLLSLLMNISLTFLKKNKWNRMVLENNSNSWASKISKGAKLSIQELVPLQ